MASLRIVCVFVLLVVSFCICQLSAGRLYATVFNQHTLNVVELSATTGMTSNISVLVEYLGKAGGIFGVSAYDRSIGNYYVATNEGGSGVYATNLKTRQLLPTTIFDSLYIVDLAFDNTNSRLFALYQVEFETTLSVGILGADSYRKEIPLPPTYNGSLATTVDGSTNTFYIAGNYQGNEAEPFLSKIDVYSGTITQVPIDPTNCAAFITKLEFDSISGHILGGGLSFNDGTAQALVLDIDPTTGKCTSFPLKLAAGGLVLDWTFDPITGILWYIVSFRGTSYTVQGYVLATGGMTRAVPVRGLPPGYSLATIEVDPNA